MYLDVYPFYNFVYINSDRGEKSQSFISCKVYNSSRHIADNHHNNTFIREN